MWTEIDILKDTKWEDFESISLLETYKIDLTHKYKLYTKFVSEYTEFLLCCDEEDASEEYQTFSRINSDRKKQIERTLDKIHQTKLLHLEKTTSHSSERCTVKSINSALAKKRAKVEAVRAKLKFADHETELIREKIKLEEEMLQ